MVASLSCVFALVFSATRQMNNVTYTNALDGTVLTHRGEHFEVVSAPFTLQYAEALHEFSPPLELPPAVVARFKDKVMAITGYETNWEIRTPSGWRAAKCTEAYTHHYQLYLFSSKADAETVNRNLHPNDDYPPTPRATSRAGRGGFTPPLAQAFFEGNGNENRGSFHGLPAGLAQFIDSPAYFRNLYHVINTRPPSGNASWGEGTDGPLPRSSAAAPGAPYSGLVECPCSTRRGDYRRTGVLAVDAPANETGQKFRALCNPAGSLLKVGNPICGHATYSGGLQCCDQGMVMLDADQAIPPAPSTYRYRLRFYFEGDAPSPSPPPREAFFLFAETEDWQSEFDVPALPPPSVHTLRRDFVAAELFGGLLGWNSPHRFNCSRVYTAMCGGREEVQRAGGNFELRYAHFHQHVGMLGGELIDADSGALLCSTYGKGVHGRGDSPLDERGYVVGIPPCVWHADAPLLSLTSNLTSVSYYDAAHRHLAVMAMWEMRGALPVAVPGPGTY